MNQVIIIHGGDSFLNYEDYLNYLRTRELTKDKFYPKKDWKTKIGDKLGKGFEILVPEMPNKTNAKFEEWKIWFERMLPFIEDGVILVGHSLGGMFLAKYLAENDFPKKVSQLHLVAPPHNKTEDVASFLLPDNLENISDQSEHIYLYFSKDDPLVPISEMDQYKRQLPNAEYSVFENRGHFKQDEFPELVKHIGSLKL